MLTREKSLALLGRRCRPCSQGVPRQSPAHPPSNELGPFPILKMNGLGTDLYPRTARSGRTLEVQATQNLPLNSLNKMRNIFYIIGVIVVIAVILRLLGLY